MALYILLGLTGHKEWTLRNYSGGERDNQSITIIIQPATIHSPKCVHYIASHMQRAVIDIVTVFFLNTVVLIEVPSSKKRIPIGHQESWN